MTEAVASNLGCSQCGGTLDPAEGQVFLTCPYCSSTVYLDRSRVVFHWSVACTVDAAAAEASLRRWMAGNHTVKDLDQKARVTVRHFEHFPLWYFRCGAPGAETVFLEPAAALSVSELKGLPLPAGDLLPYEASLDATAVRPDVPLDTVTRWAAERGVSEADVRERALVHVPVHVFKYDFEGQTWTAIVDGASGRVFANVFPAKNEGPYRAVAAAGCLVYFLLAWIPPVAYWTGGGMGLFLGTAIYAAAALLLAVPLFLAGAWISSRV